MGIEEIILNVLLSLFTNGITTLAERYDDRNKKAFDDLKEKLRNQNILEIITCESLKEIKVNNSEVDKLKLLVSDTFFKSKLAEILTKPSSENKTIQLIITEVKKHCNLSEHEPLSIEPHIKGFVAELYKRILETPSLAPFYIVNLIEESTITLQKGQQAVFDEVSSLRKEVSQLKVNATNAVPEKQLQPIDAKSVLSNKTPISQPKEEDRISRFLGSEFLSQLNNLLNSHNNIFKTSADNIKQIQKKRDFRKALELYETLLKDANSIDSEVILGIYADCALCEINLDDLTAANKWLDEAEAINSTDKRILALRGLYFYELDDKEKSRSFAEKSLAIDEFYHLALLLITAIELESGTPGHSILKRYFLDNNDTLRQGFKEEHLPVIYRTIGQCYLKDNDYDLAIEYFQKSLGLDDSDDATLSLIGLTYLREYTGPETKVVYFDKKLNELEEAHIKQAIMYLDRSLTIGTRYQNIKHHITTRANLSMCYMLLGQPNEAYDTTTLSPALLLGNNELLKSRASAAFYKGAYSEAAELLSKIENHTGQDIINEALAILYSQKTDKGKEALDVLNKFLEKGPVPDEDAAQVNYLKLEIFLNLKEKENAQTVLKLLDSAKIPEWEKLAAHGHYFATFGTFEHADEQYKKALNTEGIKIPTKVYIAEYYFDKGHFTRSLEICDSIHIKQLKPDSKLFKDFIRIAVISSFNSSAYGKCIEFIDYGKSNELEDIYLNDFAASAYWHLDDLGNARKELLTVRDKQNGSPSIDILTNLSAVSVMLGDFKSALTYITDAEGLSECYSDSHNVINCIISLLIIGNRLKARQMLNRCVDIKFEDVNDPIHRYAPVLYLREHKSELFTKYADKFNDKHGNTEWLWKKNVKKDEIASILTELSTRWNEVKGIYLHAALPLAFLPFHPLLTKKELMHYWKFNREYKLPLFLESGNPQELDNEISLLKKSKSIIVDYTALLTINEAGNSLFWLLDKAFSEIYIYRPNYLQILNDLVAEEHSELRDIIGYITSSSKFKFLSKINLPKTEIQHDEFFRQIPAPYAELFYIAKEKQLHMIVGEERLRSFAALLGVKSCGVRALFEYASKDHGLDESSVSEAIINFINKDCQFISFNVTTIDYLFTHYKDNELKAVFNKLSNQIYQPHSEFKTFFYVYLGFIQKHLKSDTLHEPLKYLIEKTIIDAKKLTSRTLSFIEFPSLNKNDYPVDMKMVNESCFAYIYELYRLVKSSNVSDQLKAEYVAIIRKNANLVYWYESTYKNAPVIKLIY